MILTIDELIETLKQARWFESLGRFPREPGYIGIRSLAAWADPPVGATAEELRISEQMDWLPTTFDQNDPFGSGAVRDGIADQGSLRAEILRVQQVALETMRGLPDHPLLHVGAHSFEKPAVGAARYCVRMVVIEVTGHAPAAWSRLLGLYVRGHWPCGILPGGDVVVL